MLCLHCNGEIRPWGGCTCREKKLSQEAVILKEKLAELEAAVHREATLADSMNDALIDVNLENDRLRAQLAEMREENRSLSRQFEIAQDRSETKTEQLAALQEAAQYAADVICLPGPHDYYHSTQDWEAMKELRAALLKQEGE